MVDGAKCVGKQKSSAGSDLGRQLLLMNHAMRTFDSCFPGTV